MIPEPARVALLVIDVLEDLEISHHLGGSFASSLHGFPRQTHDVDLVVDLGTQHVPLFVGRLENDFYIEPAMVYEAIRRCASFNLIHLATGFKIDVFVAGKEPFDRLELARHHALPLIDGSSRKVTVKSAEDTVLRKLQWYEIGGRVSDRQWNDVLGILRAQGGTLDTAYLRKWAPELSVGDLLETALSSAILPPP